MQNTAGLRLWQLISPALPVGAYAYSQGLEYAINENWVHDENSTHDWLAGLIQHTLISLDIPILARQYKAWQKNDINTVKFWNEYIQASREARELLAEDRQLGSALLKLIRDLKIPKAQHWPEDIAPSYSTMFSLAASHWMVTAKEACQGYLWSWSENQVAAAIKLVPLGQTAGQRILSKLIEVIPEAVDKGLRLKDEDIGMTAPGLGIASALHETQYTRLFRS